MWLSDWVYRRLGAGQFWWSAMALNSSVMRPCLLGTDGLHHATISGITMLDPPGWFNLLSNSSDILVSDMTMLVGNSLPDAPAKVRRLQRPVSFARATVDEPFDIEHRRLGYLSQFERRYTKLQNRQHGRYVLRLSTTVHVMGHSLIVYRLRLIQTQLHPGHRPEPRLHRIPWYLRRQSRPIPRRDRSR